MGGVIYFRRESDEGGGKGSERGKGAQRSEGEDGEQGKGSEPHIAFSHILRPSPCQHAKQFSFCRSLQQITLGLNEGVLKPRERQLTTYKMGARCFQDECFAFVRRVSSRQRLGVTTPALFTD